MTTSIDRVPGTLEHIDPNHLELEVNVRDIPALTKAFVANIAENGVLVPITAVRTEQGAVRVRTGQRRTLAAREAKLASVPVYVIDASDEPAARLIEQIVENDQRTALTAAQQARGIQQILDDGLSLAKVAKKLAMPKEAVKAAATASASKAAMDALGAGQVSLLEAAVLAEFEGDERATKRLLNCAGRPGFEHATEQLREERAAMKALTEAEDRYRAEGFTVLSDKPDSWDRGFIPLGFLLKDGVEVEEVENFVPAHWAVVLMEDSVFILNETGDEVGEERVDWSTENDPDAEAEEGLLHVSQVTETTVFTPEYYCIDHVGAGLEPNERFTKFSGMGAGADMGAGAGVGAGAVEVQVDAAEAKAEAEGLERRRTLALNRCGDAALTVRREFVRGILARKTPPKGAAVFVAVVLSRDPHLLTTNKAGEVAAELLGIGEGGVKAMVGALDVAADPRAQVLTLGMVVGALESRTPKDAWRSRSFGTTWDNSGVRQYLAFLVANGYDLAPVERVITGDRTADDVYEEHLAARQ